MSDFWMQTFSGQKYYPAAPLPDAIHIKDIAHALSNLCRFGGHCREFYSVAQHSVLVCDLVFGHLGGGADSARYALLHDASEAYLGDMVWPLKQCPELRGYREIEAATELAIAIRFKLSSTKPAVVKQADLIMLATEKRDLMTDGPGKEDGATREAKASNIDLRWAVDDIVQPWSRIIDPWPPEMARRIFLHRYDLFFSSP